MPNIANHSGHCCGMRTVYGFNGTAADWTDLDRHIRELNVPRNNNRLIEVVLAEYQINQRVLDNLSSRGFRLVTRFNNSNSDNDCLIFHHVPETLPLDFIDAEEGDWCEDLVWNGDFGPGPRQGVVPAAPPPREEPRIVISTYHNVLRAGRSEAGFGSYEQARTAAPGARSVDRRDVYASGAIRWTTGVNGDRNG